MPITKDAVIGPHFVQNLALIYAWTGEKYLALKQLRDVTKVPGYLSYSDLHLHPRWDPLRGDPRFEQIVGSPLRPEAPPKAQATNPDPPFGDLIRHVNLAAK